MSPTEIAIVLAAVTAGSLVKSITGMGLPVIAIPVMALFLPTETAVAVMAIPNAVQNVALVARHTRAWPQTRHLALFCAAGIAGAVVGALSLGVIPDWITQLVLVVLVAAYLVTTVVVPDLHIGPGRARTWTVPVALAAGLSQGGVGISGPIVATWHHGLRLTRDAFVLSVSTVFLITGVTQVTVLAVRGTLAGRVLISLLLSVLVLATVPIGARIRDRLGVEGFRRAVVGVLALSCVSLVVDLMGRVV